MNSKKSSLSKLIELPLHKENTVIEMPKLTIKQRETRSGLLDTGRQIIMGKTVTGANADYTGTGRKLMGDTSTGANEDYTHRGKEQSWLGKE